MQQKKSKIKKAKNKKATINIVDKCKKTIKEMETNKYEWSKLQDLARNQVTIIGTGLITKIVYEEGYPFKFSTDQLGIVLDEVFDRNDNGKYVFVPKHNGELIKRNKAQQPLIDMVQELYDTDPHSIKTDTETAIKRICEQNEESESESESESD